MMHLVFPKSATMQYHGGMYPGLQMYDESMYMPQNLMPARKLPLPPQYPSGNPSYHYGMHPFGPDYKPRRRRPNQSLVATMDPVAVARRNERERNRVKQVNDGFDALKKRIPFLPDKRKLSKVEILRFAMLYIRELEDLIQQGANKKQRIDFSHLFQIPSEDDDDDDETIS